MGRRRGGEPVSGWVCLDKPGGLGSTPAVSRVRRAFNAQKAGHAGTLDPLATGVLPIALGEATKTVPFLMAADKTYRVTLAWGAETDTLDADGEVTATSPARPSTSDLRAALPAFIGEIAQIPPAYSAIHVDGARAYDLARRGAVVELESRTVAIHDIRVLGEPEADRAVLEVDCGKGTYVRSLARDLAIALGTRAHVAELRRLRVGGFTEARAITLAKLQEMCDRGSPLEALLPVETALDDIPELAVTEEDAFRLTQGRSIVLLPRQVDTLRARLTASRTVFAKTVSGGRDRLVALCEMRAGRLDPTRVFHL